ncbi:MAG: hypothetical protein LUQ16_07835 [Methanomassiliicoccales archaeon]|jgi:hypothetical protein|nr:hypothetical protein [Methanomassiliicoccales archaeon]MDD1756335.1 hypothetical protein [Methanomassiliicoccales archaeon]
MAVKKKTPKSTKRKTTRRKTTHRARKKTSTRRKTAKRTRRTSEEKLVGDVVAGITSILGNITKKK